MRTNATMVALLAGAALCGFFFGLGEREAAAIPLPNCQTFNCKTIYGWYVNTGDQTKVFSAQTPGAIPPWNANNSTNNATVQLFTPNSNENTPLNGAGTFDRWSWTNFNATCAQVNGAWPAPMEVTPQGTFSVDARGVTRSTCTGYKGP